MFLYQQKSHKVSFDAKLIKNILLNLNFLLKRISIQKLIIKIIYAIQNLFYYILIILAKIYIFIYYQLFLFFIIIILGYLNQSIILINSSKKTQFFSYIN